MSLPLILTGTPLELGRQYGRLLASRIQENLRILVWREGYEPLPHQDPDYHAWLRLQEAQVAATWPWLLEEMHGVAEGGGFDYRDILQLNLRVWQFTMNKASLTVTACSSLALTLTDGNLACGGALDDPPQYYCGPLKWVPAKGHRFITFPIAGTSWGNRGMNSAGLSLGESSLGVPGLKALPGVVNQDLAARVILQTCTTVADVRRFCQQYPFTLNLVAVDARGGLFCAHQTAAGLLEIPAVGYCAMTNHFVDDAQRCWARERGMESFPESETTRFRRGRLLTFARQNSQKCTAEEVRRFLNTRTDTDPGTIHCKGTVALTFSVPQAARNTLWVHDIAGTGTQADFIPLEV